MFNSWRTSTEQDLLSHIPLIEDTQACWLLLLMLRISGSVPEHQRAEVHEKHFGGCQVVTVAFTSRGSTLVQSG